MFLSTLMQWTSLKTVNIWLMPAEKHSLQLWMWYMHTCIPCIRHIYIPYHSDVLRRYHAFPSSCLGWKSKVRKAPLMKIDARSYIKNQAEEWQHSVLPQCRVYGKHRGVKCGLRVKQAEQSQAQLSLSRCYQLNYTYNSSTCVCVCVCVCWL